MPAITSVEDLPPQDQGSPHPCRGAVLVNLIQRWKYCLRVQPCVICEEHRKICQVSSLPPSLVGKRDCALTYLVDATANTMRPISKEKCENHVIIMHCSGSVYSGMKKSGYSTAFIAWHADGQECAPSCRPRCSCCGRYNAVNSPNIYI